MMRWWVERDGRRLEVAARRLGDRFEVTVDGQTQMVEWIPLSEGLSALLCPDGSTFGVAHQHLGGHRFRLTVGQRDFDIRLRDPLERDVAAGAASAGVLEVSAPIPGKVLAVLVEPGQQVAAGTTLLILEAMKMENPIVAETDAVVESLLVSAGDTVEGGQALVRYQSPTPSSTAS